MINSSIKPTFENTLYLGFFVAAGTLVVGGRKTLSMIPKAFGKLPDGIFSGTISAGILAGTATAFSYKVSPIAARMETFLKGKEHAVGNRALVMLASTFALTFFAIRHTNGKLGSHTMSRSGALAYATIASITSIFGVAIADNGYRDNGDFFEYVFKCVDKIRKYLTPPARPPIDMEAVNNFWVELEDGTTPAKWIADQSELGYDSDASSLQKAADRIEGYDGGTHIVEIFNGLFLEGIDVFKLAKIFMLISIDKQELSLDKLNDVVKNAVKRNKDNRGSWPKSSYKHFETRYMGLDDALAAGICAGIATTVLTAVPTLALATLRSAVHSPLFNRPLTAALSVATIGAFAVHKVQKVEHDFSKAKKMLLPSFAMLAAGTLLTPSISKLVLKNRINSKAAFGYSLPAALLNLAVEWRREENNWRTVNYD